MNDSVNTYLRMAGDWDYPVFIVTAAEGDRREGCQTVKYIQPGHPA